MMRPSLTMPRVHERRKPHAAPGEKKQYQQRGQFLSHIMTSQRLQSPLQSDGCNSTASLEAYTATTACQEMRTWPLANA